MLNIKIEKTLQKRPKPDQTKLGFGNYYSDHMFIMNYTEGKGWHDERIIPYQNISLDPATMVFHYAQELFEGLKAYRTKDDRILLFRPNKNIERMNNTARRMCIPEINPEDALEAIKTLVKIDKDWVPTEEGTSLYIRPFIISTDVHIGVHPSHTYMFMIILSPVGSYYPDGINPVKIYIEREYVRAVKGGTGFAKVGGNYAASLIGQAKAAELGCAQSLWLDGIDRKYIDEVGAMNVFFVIDGKVITPSLSEGNILPGVTRASCIEILKNWGISVEERKISVDEIVDAYKNGKLNEAFGTGTAAVISPIGELNNDGYNIVVNEGKIGAVSQRLYDELVSIQWGRIEDKFGWTLEVK